MATLDPTTVQVAIERELRPWHEAVADPQAAQEAVLQRLLADYARTRYGQEHGAGGIDAIEAYRRAFPVMGYADYQPLIRRVMAGETDLLLCEEPVGWAITRGTTGDEPKFIPMTPTDLRMRVSAGRAMLHHVAATGRYDLFQGVNLNLNFPSVVGTVQVGEREVEYGYSSGSIPSTSPSARRSARCPPRRTSTPWAAAERSATGAPALRWPTSRAATRT